MKKTYCENCREFVKYSITEEMTQTNLKGKTYRHKGKKACCDICGKEVFVGDVWDYNIETFNETVRKENDIIPTEMIVQIPKKYAIDEKSLSLLLGWGEQTFESYCNGGIPSVEYSNTLKNIYNNADYYAELLEKNKAKITPEAYTKSRKAVEEIKLGARLAYISICCIGPFAEKFGITHNEARAYLLKYGGIDHIMKFYEIEHTLPEDDTMEALYKICNKNSGFLKLPQDAAETDKNVDVSAELKKLTTAMKEPAPKEQAYCNKCGKEVGCTVTDITRIYAGIDGKIYPYKGKQAVCDECGEEVTTNDVLNYNIISCQEAVRKSYNILPHAIVLAIPEKYNISPKDFAKIASLDYQAFHDYCEMRFPNPEHGKFLQKIYDDAGYYAELLEKNKDKITPGAYAKSRKAVEEILNG